MFLGGSAIPSSLLYLNVSLHSDCLAEQGRWGFCACRAALCVQDPIDRLGDCNRNDACLLHHLMASFIVGFVIYTLKGRTRALPCAQEKAM